MEDLKQKPKAGASRRDFLRGSGLAAATAVLTGQAPPLPSTRRRPPRSGAEVLSGDVKITLKVNGEERTCTVEPRSTLLDTLRNRLDVTGPKRVCDRASCGACTAIIDGDAGLLLHDAGRRLPGQDDRDPGELRHRRARRPARLPPERRPDVRLLHARLRHRVQGPLDQNPNPTLEEVRKGLDGNICRCGTYVGVIEAALAAAKAMKEPDRWPAWPANPTPDRHPHPPARRPGQGLRARPSTPPTSAPRGSSSASCSIARTPTPGSSRSTPRPPRRCPASRPSC